MGKSIDVDIAFVSRLALQTGLLDPNGEIGEGIAGQQVGIEAIIGSPQNRSLGNIGDIRIRIDVPEIWQKQSGPPRSTIGWVQLGSQGTQGVPGPQGNQGQQGTYGASDAFDNILRNVPAGTLIGSRASIGIPNAFSGAQSQPVLTSANRLSSTPRTRFATGIGVGLAATIRTGAGYWWRGNAAGLGGFETIWQFALASFASGFRSFCGFRALAALIPNVDPSTLVNIIGLGLNAGATQWSLMHNDAAGAATTIALGAAFNVSVTDLLQLRLIAAANGASVDYEVTNLSSGALAAGTIAADLPAAATFLSSHVWGNTGTDATTALLLDVADEVVETPTPTP